MDEIKNQISYRPNIDYKEDYYSYSNTTSINSTDTGTPSTNIIEQLTLIDSSLNGLPNNLSKVIAQVYDPIKDLFYEYLYDKEVDEVPPYEDSNINIDKENPKDVNIFLNKNILKLKIKQIEQLSYTTIPKNISKNDIIWQSSDNSIATVKNGLVTGVSKGVCLVTVIIKGTNAKASCRVTIVDDSDEGGIVDPNLPNVRNIYLNKRVIVIKIKENRTLKYTIVPSNASIEGVIWSSTNNSIATVVDGVVTGVAKGNCEVSVKIKNVNKIARCKVIVLNAEDESGGNEGGNEGDIDVPTSRVELSKKYIELEEEQLYQLYATIYPNDAKNKEVTWISTDQEVATVEKGLVTAVKEGQCRVIVSTVEGNKKDTCYVTVYKEEIKEPNPDEEDDDDENLGDDDDEGLWDSSDIPTIEIEVNDPRDVIPLEFLKNIYDLINYYTTNLSDILSKYYFQTLKYTTDLDNNDIKFIFDELTNDSITRLQFQHLFDVGLKNQRVSDIKTSYLENCFNINQTVLHIQSLLAIYEMRNKYINIKFQKGYNSVNSEANMILKSNNKDYDLKYEKAYFNLFKYVDSSLKITGDVMNNVSQGYKAKELLAKKGGIVNGNTTNRR